MNNLVKAENLVRSFEFGETQIHALDGVDLSINEGEFVVILGPSGAGKTTLLNMIGGIDHPTTGNIIVDGINIKDLNTKQLNEYRKNQVGWVFQFFNIVDSLRAWENVGLALEFQGNKNRKEIKEKSYKILAKVGLEGKELRFPSQLSGGEQQRVAIARALVKNPKLIVADEPTGNLDFVTGQKIAELMQTLNREEGSTFIVVSHDTSITRYADRIFHLKMGKIEKIIENPNSTENVTNLPEFKKVQE
ncbi:ABC transporter ATP-binding protein [Candidatus Lokiarchaeum ossiferum]|uniref:ABC transporter ATP-binding protein n=1 Tax=Candidatus Lokiarchaeum ossiferum TaxID=2951803 RepID=UPI00352F9B61